MKFIAIVTCLLLLGHTTLCSAATLQEELAEMGRANQAATYELEEIDEKAAAVEALIARARDLHKRYPDSALARAWIGWGNLNSAYLQTNPQASIVRLNEARSNLEAALASDPNCCGLEIYVSLAILYQFPIPGAPPPGDPQKMFDRALAIQPNGVIPNTRYAGYLMRKGELDAALKHAKLALAAPPLANRPGEDKAVRAQAQIFVEQITERMKK